MHKWKKDKVTQRVVCRQFGVAPTAAATISSVSSDEGTKGYALSIFSVYK